MRRSSCTRRAVAATGAVIGILAATCIAAPDAAADELSLEALSPTRLQPLFSPTRRPPEAARPVSAPAQQRAKQPDAVLTAVIIGTDIRAAIFKRSGETKTLSLAPGGEIEGWKLTRIDERQVQLRRDTDLVTLPLAKGSGPSAAKMIVPPAPARQRRAEEVTP
jgi:hypothetical protein